MPIVNRIAPDEQHVQAIIFAKGKWTEAQSRDWLREHDYYTDGYDESESYHRWRQYDPNSDKFSYRTKEIDEGLKLIIGFVE